MKDLVSQVWEFRLDLLGQWVSNCGAQQSHCFILQILGSYPRPTESEIAGLGPSHQCLNTPLSSVLLNAESHPCRRCESSERILNRSDLIRLGENACH